MKKIIFTLLAAALCTGIGHAEISPYDENDAVGWASIGVKCTGSNNQNPVVVTTEEELRAAMQSCKGGKASKTIFISGEIEVKEKLRYDGMKNCTIYGLPGSSLYYYEHTDNADSNPGFYCQKWENCIIRNVTIKGPGAYDISGCDNISLVGCTNIWIDHCDLQDGMDGNLDAKDGANKITVSWCKFSYMLPPWPNSESPDHRCSSMWGSSNSRDEEGYLNTTFVNCWWYHGCGQRCPRIRYGNVHIANCLWENGTDDDPAQYCVGIGHGADLYIENGDFSNTVIKSGQTDMRGHNKYYLTEKKVYELTVTGCIGEDDGQEMGPGCTTGYYDPYADPAYKCRVYDASLVKSVLTNPDNGAGATLDEDELITRGNDNYGQGAAVKSIDTDASVIGISYYSLDGVQIAAPQPGVNIIRMLMSDGSSYTKKIVVK